MEYIIVCSDRELLAVLCTFADQLATLLVALAAFTHGHRVWFRLWLPLGETTPSRDTVPD